MLRRLRFDRIGNEKRRSRYEQQQGENPFHAQNKRLTLRRIALGTGVSINYVVNCNKIQEPLKEKTENEMVDTGVISRLHDSSDRRKRYLFLRRSNDNGSGILQPGTGCVVVDRECSQCGRKHLRDCEGRSKHG